MADFSGLPWAILLSISALSGDAYRDVDGEEVTAELERRGLSPDHSAFAGAMRALKDTGYVEAYFTADNSVHLIRLSHPGRQEVEGWPTTPGSISASDVQELVSVLLARADDVDVPETERSKARAAAGALKDLGVGVTGQVIFAWLKQIGVA